MASAEDARRICNSAYRRLPDASVVTGSREFALWAHLRLRRFLRSRRFFEPIFLRRLGLPINLLLLVPAAKQPRWLVPLQGHLSLMIYDDAGWHKAPLDRIICCSDAR